MRWSYNHVPEVHEDDMIVVMDNYGADEWELVSANRYVRDVGDFRNIKKEVMFSLVFKRPTYVPPKRKKKKRSRA